MLPRQRLKGGSRVELHRFRFVRGAISAHAVPTNLPVELLQTFLLLIECGGDASDRRHPGHQSAQHVQAAAASPVPREGIEASLGLPRRQNMDRHGGGPAVSPASGTHEPLRAVADSSWQWGGGAGRGQVRLRPGRAVSCGLCIVPPGSIGPSTPRCNCGFRRCPGPVRIEGVANGVIDWQRWPTTNCASCKPAATCTWRRFTATRVPGPGLPPEHERGPRRWSGCQSTRLGERIRRLSPAPAREMPSRACG